MSIANGNGSDGPEDITPTGSSFSRVNGFVFVFPYRGHSIRSWFSAWSGAEKVFVDDQLVATGRNYKRRSAIEFRLDGERLSTMLDTVSLLTGPIVCTLLKDGEPIQQQRLVFPAAAASQPVSWAERIHLVLLWAGLGVLLMVLQNHFGWPGWTVPLLLGLVLIVGPGWRGSSRSRPTVQIENVVLPSLETTTVESAKTADG